MFILGDIFFKAELPFKHLFALFLNFYVQSTLNCMTSSGHAHRHRAHSYIYNINLPWINGVGVVGQLGRFRH